MRVNRDAEVNKYPRLHTISSSVLAMSSACKAAVGRLEVNVPERSTYSYLQRWAESDAEFVRSLSTGGTPTDSRRSLSSPVVVDSYSCRQKFLRSYTFSKRETVPEKTVKCLGRVKQRAAVFPCIYQEREDSGEISKAFTSRRRRKDYYKRQRSLNQGKSWRSILCTILGRLLSCMAGRIAEGAAVHAL